MRLLRPAILNPQLFRAYAQGAGVEPPGFGGPIRPFDLPARVTAQIPRKTMVFRLDVVQSVNARSALCVCFVTWDSARPCSITYLSTVLIEKYPFG